MSYVYLICNFPFPPNIIDTEHIAVFSHLQTLVPLGNNRLLQAFAANFNLDKHIIGVGHIEYLLYVFYVFLRTKFIQILRDSCS